MLFTVAINLNATDLYQTTGNLNLRSGPSTKYNSIGVIKNGEKVNVIEKTNSLWFKIEYNGKSGFLSSKYLTPITVKLPQLLETHNADAETTSLSFSMIFIIITALVVILIIIFALSNKNKPTSSRNSNSNSTTKIEIESKEEIANDVCENTLIEASNPTSNRIYNEEIYNKDWIIDVTDESYRVSTTSDLKKYSAGVPFWPHHYVYSNFEINSASNEQKKFYSIFKNNFLNGNYLDLEGNTNYAFILLFDLLNEYEQHKDIPKLEKQLRALGLCYPKTKSYGVSFLIKKMDARGDNVGASRLREEGRDGYQINTADYDYWRLGNKYKTSLNLNDDEVKLLNRILNPSSVFCSIENCLLEILKLYMAAIIELKAKYIQVGTTLEEQFQLIADIMAGKHFKYKVGSSNYKYCIELTTNEMYSNIFRHCENAVRKHYGQKRKVNTHTYAFTPEAEAEFESKIIPKVTEILPTLVSKITPPDEATDIELYSQNTSRWKIKFEELTANYRDNPNQFVESIVKLGNLNKKNPSVENIFFEASKFMSKHDKGMALTLYIHYLYHDLNSTTFDNKQMTKTIQKNLFKTNEQLHNFGIVVSELIKDKNLDKALQNVSKIYVVKRKKIQLDTASIQEVQMQDSETVELLNEYLKDEYEDENNLIKTREINDEEVTIEITKKGDEVQGSIYLSNIAFTSIHLKTLEIFAKRNFSVPQSELETFAKSKGIFKNQLIESINEICYEVLDDVLIEEENDYYTINPNYYQRLLAK